MSSGDGRGGDGVVTPMTPTPETMSERMLKEAYVGGIAGWDDMIDEVAKMELWLKAADLTIGTLQADRIKAQATIDHYRTMLAEAEKLAAYGERQLRKEYEAEAGVEKLMADVIYHVPSNHRTFEAFVDERLAAFAGEKP